MTDDRHGAVAAGHQLTAKAAGDVLSSGGNAFDAAIAAAWMACVCEPILASPGGGGFAMIKAGADKPLAIDFFAQTPKRKNLTTGDFREIHADFGETTQSFHIGCGSTATPGMVPGLFHLHGKQATLPMEQLLAPAIRAARNGLAVTPYQHLLSAIVSPILVASAEAQALFAPGGHLIKAGETFTNSGLGDLLEILAAGGLPGYFDHVVPAMLQSLGVTGHLSGEDFGGFCVIEREPVKLTLNDLTAWLNPLPSAGGTLIAHTLGAMDDLEPLTFAKALDRTDRERSDIASALSAILRDAGTASYRGTTHISVIDSHGNACAVTLSNGEGNGEIAGSFGFMPNNMLGESDVNPNGALGWQEDRRLSSMMCPAVCTDADGAVYALGSGGSNRIRSAIANVLRRLAAGGCSLDQAITSPRLHIERGHLDAEGQFCKETVAALTGAFSDHHIWPEPNMFFGGCHAVAGYGDGALVATGDARRDGVGFCI